MLSAQDISLIDTNEPIVCLTFDDGPTGENTFKFLEVLRDYQAKATFFVIGNKINGAPEALKAVHAEGHEIGNHTFSHPNLVELKSESSIREEIESCQFAVEKCTGIRPKIFRAPYLAQDESVVAVLNDLGLPSVFCSADSRDWDPESTEESILQRLIDGLNPGAVLLMHEFSDKTVKILPKLLDAIREKGLRPVTVSEALAIEETSE